MVRIKRPRVYHKIEQFWAMEQSFTVLLLLLVVDIFGVVPFMHERDLGRIVFAIFYFLLISTGIVSVTQAQRRIIIVFFGLATLVFLCSEIFFQGLWVKILSDLFYVVYCVVLASVVLVKTFAGGHFSRQRIVGAISVYLLVSVVFSLLYHVVFLIYGNSAFKGLRTFERYEFMYFSLSTLTTVGYGDISPSVIVARTLSNIEGLLGQLYPAILIARLVSMELISSSKFEQ